MRGIESIECEIEDGFGTASVRINAVGPAAAAVAIDAGEQHRLAAQALWRDVLYRQVAEVALGKAAKTDRAAIASWKLRKDASQRLRADIEPTSLFS